MHNLHRFNNSPCALILSQLQSVCCLVAVHVYMLECGSELGIFVSAYVYGGGGGVRSDGGGGEELMAVG